MKKGINLPGMATVIAKDGFQQIQLPSGEILPGVIKTIVTDEVDNIPTAVVTIMVNIENNK